MIIGSVIITGIIGLIFLIMSDSSYHEELYLGLGGILFLISVIILIFGCFNGFINYPKTEGTHQGIITAVDLEGVYFRRYEVYLKSSGYTNQSDETVYKIYDYEIELAEKLQEAIGKTVKIHYGHDGGYIGWKSCGTYHIKDFEIIEEE